MSTRSMLPKTNIALSEALPGRGTALLLLFGAGVVNFFDRTALSIANTPVRAELHLSATQMGWLLSAFSLAYGITQLPLVEVLRRVSTRRVLGVGLGVWSFAQLCTGFVSSIPVFLLLRALLGAGESPFYPCGVQIIREWFAERQRGRATAVMSMSQTLGLAAAPPILTWFMLHWGWRTMFVTLGGAGLLAAAAWFLLYRPAPVFPETIAAGPIDTRSRLWRMLLRQRMVWGMMLGFGGINYTVWLYTSWLPGFLQAAHHLALGKTGWVAAIPFLGGAAGMFASGLVTDLRIRRGRVLLSVHRQNLVLGMVCSAASTYVVAQSSSVTRAVAGITAALFFIHFAGTSGWGLVQAAVRAEQVSSLAALQNFASFLIASAAPVLTGWLLDRTQSFVVALSICSAVTLLGALSYATLARSPQMAAT